MSFLQSIKSSTLRMIDTYQKKQVMRALQELSNSQLEDIGVSRHLLARGISAYPWREGIEEEHNLYKQKAPVLTFSRPTTSTPVMGSAATQQAA